MFFCHSQKALSRHRHTDPASLAVQVVGLFVSVNRVSSARHRQYDIIQNNTAIHHALEYCTELSRTSRARQRQRTGWALRCRAGPADQTHSQHSTDTITKPIIYCIRFRHMLMYARILTLIVPTLFVNPIFSNVNWLETTQNLVSTVPSSDVPAPVRTRGLGSVCYCGRV